VIVPSHHPYRKRSDNARAVAKGLTQAERIHKAAIAGGQTGAIEFAARVHYLTVGMLAETLLRKTIDDPSGFNDRERGLLRQERRQIGRWVRAVDLGFRRQYSVPVHLAVDVNSTNATVANRHHTLIDLLERDLVEIIEDRNKLAHGQWAWLLNSSETSFVGSAPRPLNYRQIEVRGDLVVQIAALVRDLSISEPTFERDFAAKYAVATDLRSRLPGLDYADLVSQLRARRR
jgi:hypothetical protein